MHGEQGNLSLWGARAQEQVGGSSDKAGQKKKRDAFCTFLYWDGNVCMIIDFFGCVSVSHTLCLVFLDGYV